MLKNILKLNGLMLLMVFTLFTSCTKETENVTPDNFGETESFEMQKRLNVGKKGCLEVIFPINITLPDGTNIEVESFQDARAQFTAWKEANPDVDGKPQIVYPIEIITMDGETVSINEKSEIRALLKDCRGNHGDRPRDCKACFKLQYPLSISFPDDTSVEFDSRSDLKQALRQWKNDNPDATERPSLEYPIVIVFDDDSTQTINSKEELEAAKEACQEE